MSNTPQLLSIKRENTDLDSIAATFEKDGIVVLNDFLAEHWISSADQIANRLLIQLDDYRFELIVISGSNRVSCG